MSWEGSQDLGTADCTDWVGEGADLFSQVDGLLPQPTCSWLVGRLLLVRTGWWLGWLRVLPGSAVADLPVEVHQETGLPLSGSKKDIGGIWGISIQHEYIFSTQDLVGYQILYIQCLFP